LRQDVAGGAATEDGALVAVEKSLVAIHDWTLLFRPSMLLAYLMYRSQLDSDSSA
jgi:hypothetical protein